MPWRLNKNGVTPDRPLTRTEQEKLNYFMGGVQSGKDPAVVVTAFDYDYKQLSNGRWQIRLSQEARAHFLVDRANLIVTMLYVGGHP